MPSYIGFVDAGFLKAEGAKALGREMRSLSLSAEKAVNWLRLLPQFGRGAIPRDMEFLRTYWYDGAFDPKDNRWTTQRRYFDAIAHTPGLQLRLGHIVERRPGWQHALRIALKECGVDMELFSQHFDMRPELSQKGVGALIVLDLVRLAQNDAYDTAILIAGDRDLAEAVRTAQDYGRRVLLGIPEGAGVANEVRQLADDIIVIDKAQVKKLFDEATKKKSVVDE